MNSQSAKIGGIVRSGRPLTILERGDIADLLQDSLEVEAQLRREIALLEEKLAVQEADSQLYRAALSPTRSLPRDVLEEIFLRCLPSDGEAPMNASDAPMLLCRICRTWAYVAISTPALWASIHVVTAPVSVPRYKARTEFVYTWLTRARTSPLSISVYTGFAEDCNNSLEIMLGILKLFSKLWQSLTLNVPLVSKKSLSPLMSLFPDHVPMLETFKFFPGGLSIYGGMPGGLEDFWHEVPFFTSSSLKEIDVPTFFSRLYVYPNGEAVVFDRLTKLTLHGWENSIIVTYLTICLSPNLESLSIFLSPGPHRLLFGLGSLPERAQTDQESYDKTMTATIHLPRLEFFMIRDDGGEVSERFFSLLLTPCLSSFTYFGKNEEASPPAFSHFLSQRQMPLEALSIGRSHLRDEAVMQYLKGNSTIEELCIRADRRSGDMEDSNEGEDSEDELLKLLHPAGGVQDTVCPYLRRIELDAWEMVSEDALVEFLNKRAAYRPDDEATKYFKSAFINQIRRQIGKEIIPRLPHGMSIRITCATRESERDREEHDSRAGLDNSRMGIF